jgi:phosphatidylserine decarboxylase
MTDPTFHQSSISALEADRPVRFRNRETGAFEEERIYGEKWLRRIYGTPLGTLALHILVKRAIFSVLYGAWMDRPSSAGRVEPFVREYGLDCREFLEEDLGAYGSFNAFFFRKLKASARPVDGRPGVAVLPADGRHLGFSDISKTRGVFTKGQRLEVGELVGDRALGERYARGTVVCSRLCPVDYHRFHFPVGGVPGPAVLTPGALYSVNPLALRRRVSFLWENKRQRVSIEAGPFGLVTVVAVGATNVGSMVETYEAGRRVAKGEERGYFRFGGSFLATLFEPGRVVLEEDLVRAGEEGVELYAKMGTPLGRLREGSGESRVELAGGEA